MGAAFLVFLEHHADRPSLARDAVLFQGGKQDAFFLEMVTLIGEVTKKIECFAPMFERAGDRHFCQLLQAAEHPLYHAMFIAKNLARFLRFMRAAAAMRNHLFHLIVSFYVLFSMHIVMPPFEIRLCLYAPVLPGSRLINAIRIALHRITGNRMRARPAAATDRFKLAHAAFAFELRVIAHPHKHV